jgi:hypothetical protein
MFAIGVERDRADQTVACVVGFTSGVITGWLAGWQAGVACWFTLTGVIGCITEFATELRTRRDITDDVRRAAKHVERWFVERFPDEEKTGVAVRAIEPDRYVISIYYRGMQMPPPRRYFAISRSDFTHIHEVPDTKYWPRGLK